MHAPFAPRKSSESTPDGRAGGLCSEGVPLTWIAAAFGVAGGLALTFTLARALFPLTRAVVGGVAAALLPALLLALAVGAPLGAALGRQMFRELGVPASGEVFGVAAGVAVVLAAVIVAGGAAGHGIAKAVGAYRLWRS